MKFGVIVSSLDASQIGYTVTAQLNQTINLGHQPILFFATINKSPVIPLFAQFNLYQMWGFHHPVIATDMLTAEYLLHAPGPTRKFLYVWDCEWMYDSSVFERYMHIYKNNALELIARSQTHADLLTKCWKSPITIIEDFNYEQICNAIK